MVVWDKEDFYELIGTPCLEVVVGGTEKVLSVVMGDLVLVF